MSAPQIPNLKTLRTGGGRGRNRGGLSVGSNSVSKDEIIKGTDNDAATSRLSAVDAGYLVDPFATILTPGAVQRRLPLMNRGTYTRTMGIDRLVATFLASCTGRKQIISLGAGSDTRFFRLKAEHPGLDIAYHEIDFASNIQTKVERLKNSSAQIKELSGIEIAASAEQHIAHDYHLHALDLRTLNSNAPVISGMEQVPTLLISECCLIYLSPEDADAVIDCFNKVLTTPTAVVIYEPIRPNDSFGRTMVKNLTARGIRLTTLEKYADLSHQCQRLTNHGLISRAADMDYIWRNWIDDAEKERIGALEWMDETEEFVLLAKHYCISWGWKGFADDRTWQQLPTE